MTKMSYSTFTPDQKIGGDSEVKVRIVDDFLQSQGYKNPREMRIKFLLATHIENQIDDRGLSQAEAADISGASQSDISRIMNAKVDGYSVFRLAQIASALGIQTSLQVNLPNGETDVIQFA